jgi:hypothetical protein
MNPSFLLRYAGAPPADPPAKVVYCKVQYKAPAPPKAQKVKTPKAIREPKAAKIKTPKPARAPKVKAPAKRRGKHPTRGVDCPHLRQVKGGFCRGKAMQRCKDCGQTRVGGWLRAQFPGRAGGQANFFRSLAPCKTAPLPPAASGVTGEI